MKLERPTTIQTSRPLDTEKQPCYSVGCLCSYICVTCVCCTVGIFTAVFPGFVARECSGSFGVSARMGDPPPPPDGGRPPSRPARIPTSGNEESPNLSRGLTRLGSVFRCAVPSQPAQTLDTMQMISRSELPHADQSSVSTNQIIGTVSDQSAPMPTPPPGQHETFEHTVGDESSDISLITTPIMRQSADRLERVARRAARLQRQLN